MSFYVQKPGLSSRVVHKILNKRLGIKIDGSPVNPCLTDCGSVRRLLKYVAFYVQTVRKKAVAARRTPLHACHLQPAITRTSLILGILSDSSSTPSTYPDIRNKASFRAHP